MKLLDFNSLYPNEAACIAKLREVREKSEHVCPRCGQTQWYWKHDKLCFECKRCHHRESLRTGTVMENSKLPFLYWFKTIHLLTSTKTQLTTLEVQHQLGHKRYQPVWEMVHKLRPAIERYDKMHTMFVCIEIDENTFAKTPSTTATSDNSPVLEDK